MGSPHHDDVPKGYNPSTNNLDLHRSNLISICDIKNIYNYTGARTVDLSKNKLTTIDCIDDFHVIEELNLSDNLISQIDNIDHLDSLKILKLNNNKIKTINPLKFPHLETLDKFIHE